MPPRVENWDDDGDFQGDLFGASQSTGAPPSISSRVSVRSESVAGDDDWQVLVTADDELSKAKAISSANQVGIPIPQNVPPSALLGATIKKLGKKKSRRNDKEEDCDDLVIPDNFVPNLKLKPGLLSPDAPRSPTTPANAQDEFDTDWAEGSLGIRFGGTRRELRNRSSSVSAANSAMSPSMGSCLTLESEEDELGGLVLPDVPIDFRERLKKRREKEVEQEPVVPGPGALDTKQAESAPIEQLQRNFSLATEEDPLDGLELGNVDLLDNRKRKFNVNIKINDSKVNPSPPRMATTTVTFTDKPTVSRIPRPTPPPGKSKLDPVYESMASHIAPRNIRPPPTTTGAQLLRSKRSAPALGSRPKESSRPAVPFVPAGVSPAQSSNIHTRPQGHGRTHSEHDRPLSPTFRSFSRMSVAQKDDTPNQAGFRRDVLAPVSLARQAINQRTLQVTKRRHNYGDGSELERFDDLPTSATKESKFIKEPANRGPPKTLRHQISRNQLRVPERINTPQPQLSYPSSVASSTLPSTPLAPVTPRGGYFAASAKPDTTPRFARDTAASRIRADQRINSTISNPRDRPGSGGPLQPVSINWKAQVAARSPHISPTTSRNKLRKDNSKQPILIKQMTPSDLAKSKHLLLLYDEPCTNFPPRRKRHDLQPPNPPLGRQRNKHHELGKPQHAHTTRPPNPPRKSQPSSPQQLHPDQPRLRAP
jgi:hypothetical protein